MNDNFLQYESMRDAGSTPEEVYRASTRDGLDSITRIRLIRAVYSMSLRQAKEVWVRAENVAESLAQYQARTAEVISPILERTQNHEPSQT
jgi:hypothetical protein